VKTALNNQATWNQMTKDLEQELDDIIERYNNSASDSEREKLLFEVQKLRGRMEGLEGQLHSEQSRSRQYEAQIRGQSQTLSDYDRDNKKLKKTMQRLQKDISNLQGDLQENQRLYSQANILNRLLETEAQMLRNQLEVQPEQYEPEILEARIVHETPRPPSPPKEISNHTKLIPFYLCCIGVGAFVTLYHASRGGDSGDQLGVIVGLVLSALGAGATIKGIADYVAR
jgi:hypothetical protein